MIISVVAEIKGLPSNQIPHKITIVKDDITLILEDEDAEELYLTLSKKRNQALQFANKGDYQPHSAVLFSGDGIKVKESF